MRMRWPALSIALAFISGLLALLHGCGNRMVSSTDIPGSYSAEYRLGGTLVARESLTLGADGRYEQVFRLASGESFRHSGRWQFDTDLQGRSLVYIQSRLTMLDESGMRLRAKPAYENWFLPVVVRRNRVIIDIDSDMGYEYVRVTTGSGTKTSGRR